MAGRKRRKWSIEEKISICLQTKAPGVSVSQVARRYAMSGNQIFNWLKDTWFSPGEPDEAIEDAVFYPSRYRAKQRLSQRQITALF